MSESALTPRQQEARRVVQICNACRYCEGFCAVFPALERRLDFTTGDLNYLAHLCHDCRQCYYSCQYAPPHEFEVNIPRVMAGLRREHYLEYAWPAGLARMLGDSRLALLLSIVIIPLLFFLLALLLNGPAALFAAYGDGEGAFYALVSHQMMVWGFGLVSLFIIAALATGWRRFRRDIGGGGDAGGGLARAVHDSLRLRYLGGAGEGCAYPQERPSHRRRVYHHFTMYGFLLCLAATSVASLYHYGFGWQAPYPLLSVPVILGSLGGLGLLIGPPGLYHLKRRRDPELAEPLQERIDNTFLILLFLTSLTGLLLLALRETAFMGVLLVAHLGLVMGLFLTLPYGKFVHALYRFAALLRNAREEKVV